MSATGTKYVPQPKTNADIYQLATQNYQKHYAECAQLDKARKEKLKQLYSAFMASKKPNAAKEAQMCKLLMDMSDTLVNSRNNTWNAGLKILAAMARINPNGTPSTDKKGSAFNKAVGNVIETIEDDAIAHIDYLISLV